MKRFFHIFIFSFLLFAIVACSSEPLETNQTTDASGGLSNVDQLYAKAYILWGRSEKCSDPEKAIALLNSALDINPKHAPSLFRRGLAFNQLGFHLDAFEDFSTAIASSPKAEYHAWRAYLLMKEGNMNAAELDLQRAEELDENDRNLIAFKGVFSLLNGDEKSACDNFEEAARHGITSWLEKAQMDNMCK